MFGGSSCTREEKTDPNIMLFSNLLAIVFLVFTQFGRNGLLKGAWNFVLLTLTNTQFSHKSISADLRLLISDVDAVELEAEVGHGLVRFGHSVCIEQFEQFRF